jgi:hypothetical protein
VRTKEGIKRLLLMIAASGVVFVVILIAVGARRAEAAGGRWRGGCTGPSCATVDGPYLEEGTWYWLRSPDQEKRAVMRLYNLYCIRCHGVDGRGIWDIPDVPNFTNERWQASRSDGQLARIILEGRGAVMPPFRGALSLEEAWAMARYLRTFVPGTEMSRPDLSTPSKTGTPR